MTIAEREYKKWSKYPEHNPTDKAIACQVIGLREYWLYQDNSAMRVTYGSNPPDYCPLKDFYVG